MNQDALYALLYLVAWSICGALAIGLYSMAQARAAFVFGDRGAWGHRSLDPLSHVDPVGSILLPLVLSVLQSPVILGYGRGWPIDYAALAPRRRGAVMVALAGPLAGLAISLVATLLLALAGRRSGGGGSWTLAVMGNFISIGIWLCVFSFVPLPGQPGARIAVALMPRLLGPPYRVLEPYSWPIMVLLLGVLPGLGRLLDWQINFLGDLITAVTDPIIAGLLRLAM